MHLPDEAVQELRKQFLEKLQQEYNNSPVRMLFVDIVHPVDVEKVKHNDSWLQRFLLHHDQDIKEAFHMLWDTCEWRKSYNVNDINDNTVNMDYVQQGGLFPYGFDKDGKPMLIFKCKTHIKGTKNFEDLKRMLIYWFERLERQYNGDQITVFFDMAETGLSNMDMEYVRYLINLNKLYYPHFLNYILIYEMPWILNAAFKIIKSWLPAKAVQKIKFINKGTLKEFVDPKFVLTCWGGDDDFAFTFHPEVRIEIPTVSSSNSKFDDIRKKVHFMGVNGSSNENSPVSSSFRDTRSDENNTTVCQTNLLNVIHPDTLYFNYIEGEYIGLINIENISGRSVLFKIKTTSPERFRVKPSFGIIHQGVATKITVIVQGGLQMHSILKDKFLVMSMIAERDDLTSTEVNDIWKQSEGVKIEQHRLKVSIIEPVTQCHSGKHTCGVSEELVQKVDQLKTMVSRVSDSSAKMGNDVSFKQNLLIFLNLFLLIILLILLYFVYQERSILQKFIEFGPPSAGTCSKNEPDL